VAGDFAKIYNTVWTDADWRALNRGQQWLYWTLYSQAELTYAGVLTTTERRLTGCAADFTVDELRADLAELEKRDYVVVDEEHDEILVRTYIKWDDAWRTPNVLVGILRAATAVRSPKIRARLAEELARLDVASMNGKRAEEMRRRVADAIRTLRPRVPGTVPARVSGTVRATVTETVPEGLGEPFREPFTEPIGEPSVVVAVVVEEPKDRTSVTHGQDQDAADRPPPAEPVADGDGETTANGVLINLPSARPRSGPKPGSDNDPHWRAFWDAYPRKVSKGHARAAWAKAAKRASPDAIVKAAEAYRDDPARPRDHQYIPHPATWLNGDRWLDEQPRAADRVRPGTSYVEIAPPEFNP
jgi:hypothetical protein